jgi:hypothetical protein
LVTCSVLHAASTMPEPRDATRKPRLGQMMRGAQHRIRCCWRLRYNRLTRSSRRDYLLFFPGNTGDSDIFALAASSFWFLSAMSCFLDLSFAFGDLSPMVIASCSLSSGMLPPFQGKSKTIARGPMSDSAVATCRARPEGRRKPILQRVRLGSVSARIVRGAQPSSRLVSLRHRREARVHAGQPGLEVGRV